MDTFPRLRYADAVGVATPIGSETMLQLRRPDPQEYLKAVPLTDRRRNGQVYTPRHLVEFVLDRAGLAAEEAIDRTLLDPACGCGAFLEAAAFRLAERIKTTVSARNFRSHLIDAIETCLYGVDIDPQACAHARDAICAVVQEVAPGPIPKTFFRNNIICADFLCADHVAKLRPLHRRGGFDFIVGNPPYVATTRISAAQKFELRKRFKTATGRFDLYALFIERSLQILAPNGRLTFITPDKFLVSRTGRAVRELIRSSASVRTIALFRSHKLFADAATVPCVTVLDRGNSASSLQVFRCAEVQKAATRRIVIRERRSEKAELLTAGPWHFLNSGELELVQRLRATHARLRDLTTRISAGIATGRDNIFVFPADSQPNIEPVLRRRVVRGRDIDAYGISDPGLEMVIPYTFDPSTGTPRLVNLSSFPGARRYLTDRRDELDARHCVKVWTKSWYDLHDPLTFDLPGSVKILVPDVANSNRFAVDVGRFLPLHSAYYVLPKAGVDPRFLVGVLNSAISTYLVRLVAPVVKDGFSRYRAQFLADIPVPNPTNSMRDAIIDAAETGNTSRVDDLVASLFGISDRELGLIASSIAVMAEQG